MVHFQKRLDRGKRDRPGSLHLIERAYLLANITSQKALAHLLSCFAIKGTLMFNGEVRKAFGCIQAVGPFKRPGWAGIQAERTGTAEILDRKSVV